MKLLKIISAAAMAIVLSHAYAVETESESNQAVTNDAKREANKTVNRVKEAVCMESDTECLKQKVQHRIEETKETIKDKTKEIKNNVN
jgi:hypothetical protein